MQPRGKPGPQQEGSAQRGAGQQALALVAFLAASFGVAAIGGFSTVDNVNGWYSTADKAPWSPPNWIFGPVWTVLYTAMAVAAWLVWRKPTASTRRAMTAYGIQLLLNLAWTPVFFGLYPALGSAALWLALAIIVALMIAVSVTVLYFGPVSRTAGLLLLPYIAWIVFASTLNWWAAVHN